MLPSPPPCNQVLASMASEREICPTVWETGEPAAVCSYVNYITLSTPPDVGTQCVGRVPAGRPPPHRPSRGSRPAPCEVSNSPSPQALATLESVIKSSFVHKGNRSHDYVGGHVWSDKQNEEVYEVDASEGVEATLHDLLIQAGGRAGGGEGRREEGRARVRR